MKPTYGTKGTLRPKQQLDPAFDDTLDWWVVVAIISVIGGIALWGALR